MRSFISITPPQQIVEQIAALQRQVIAALGVDATRALDLARADKFHLTLRFLGETDAQQRSLLEAALMEIAARHTPISIELATIGVFPNQRRPSVLWVGIGANGDLSRLQAAVEKAAQGAGFPAEGRAWSPHLTLARVRRTVMGGALKQLSAGVQRVQEDEMIGAWRASFTAHGMELMRSELLPQGARYTVLGVFPFEPLP